MVLGSSATYFALLCDIEFVIPGTTLEALSLRDQAPGSNPSVT